MGGGIAMTLQPAGIPVTIVETNTRKHWIAGLKGPCAATISSKAVTRPFPGKIEKS